MRTYLVLSSELQEIVEAESHRDAAAKAIRAALVTDNPPRLSGFVAIHEVVGSEVYANTRGLLDSLGLLAEA